MKSKDIIIVISALLVIAVCGYFGYSLLFSGPKNQDQSVSKNEKPQETTVPKNIDQTTYQTINTLSDYGKPPLSGLGKPDLFANF